MLGNVFVRAAVVEAEDADVGFRVLLLLLMLVVVRACALLLMLVVVRACEGDHEIAIGLSSQLLAADSGRRLHKFLALDGGDCSTNEVGGRVDGLDNLAHSSIVPLLGHRDVVSMKTRGRVRGETHTFEGPARVISERALRGRAAPAVMSIAPSCTVAPTTAPTPVICTVAPTSARTPVGKRDTRHEHRTARVSWSSRSYRDEKVALRFLRELQADVICAER
jgi:hypothetical protein